MESKKIFTVENKGVVDKDNNKLIGVIGSTGSIDRHGESVNPMGWLLDNFKLNPVIQWAHNYDQLPVGKAERVYIEDNSLKFDIKFADTAFAKDVFKLFVDGMLNAFSVGFIPKRWGVPGQDTFDIMEQELLELSVVPVPANPEALALVKSFASKYQLEATIEEPKEDEKPEEKDETVVEEEPAEENAPSATDGQDESEQEDKGDESSVEVPATEVVEEAEAVEDKSDEATDEDKEELPEGEEESDETPEEKTYSPKTLALLKEIASLFKKADQANEKGLSLLKQLKNALQN